MNQLQARGYSVSALFRASTEFSQELENRGVRTIYGDLADSQALKQLVSKAQAVYHCAAYMGKRNYQQSCLTNIQGMVNLLNALDGSSIKLFIYVSSISVYRATPAKVWACLIQTTKLFQRLHVLTPPA